MSKSQTVKKVVTKLKGQPEFEVDRSTKTIHCIRPHGKALTVHELYSYLQSYLDRMPTDEYDLFDIRDEQVMTRYATEYQFKMLNGWTLSEETFEDLVDVVNLRK